MKKTIACIGNGFVGGALTTVFVEKGYRVFAFDKANVYVPGATVIHTNSLDDCSSSLEEYVKLCETYEDFRKIYFVCVPTPMFDDGECDTSIVENVLDSLASVPGKRIAVVKSTIPPGTTKQLNKKYGKQGLSIVFNPEFLREMSALDDMRNQSRIILGGSGQSLNDVKILFQEAFKNIPVIKTDSSTAEFIKYFTNIQLAARVLLSCEFYEMVQHFNEAKDTDIDYDKIVEYSKYDKRLGDSHMNVPGHDGVCGVRGHCFPKDLNALIYASSKMGFNPKLLKSLNEKNLDIVPPEHRDWEKMIGRAYKKRNE